METNVDKLKRKGPFVVVTFLFLLSFYFFVRGLIKLILIFIVPLQEDIPSIMFLGETNSRSLVEFFISVPILIFTWMLATRVKQYQSVTWRVIFFILMLSGITVQFLWNATMPVRNNILPYVHERAESLDVINKEFQQVLYEQVFVLDYTLLSIPAIVIFLMFMYMAKLYNKYHKETNELFKEWEFRSAKLQSFLRTQEEKELPDVVLGPDSESGELVVQKWKDRSLHNLIVGSIGTGKTASLLLPVINQDLHHISTFINKFSELYSKEDYDSEDVKGRYLNGITVVEPSNDLCQKVFQLVKAHNIPEEAVFYIDPTDPNTKSINPLLGPVDKVAEVFTSVIEGLGENQEFFFEQSQRVHLKHYIYLLKLHDTQREPTFDDLIDMYNEPQLVRKMHEKLKKTIPENYNDIGDRDERNYWKIVKGIDDWFNANLLPEFRKVGSNNVPVVINDADHEYYGEAKYFDAKAEHVVGLRNILNDLSANLLIRRVLFGKTEFSFDKHLEYGGILLVNSAKGELSELSNVLGKFILLSMQNAVFRRPPNVSTLHHLVIDEFPDYIYSQFSQFPAQSRKYKCITTVACQTISQLAHTYGNTYMETLIGTFRHRFVFGDIPLMDAEYFAKLFGDSEEFKEGEMDQVVGPLQENTMRRTGMSFQKEEENILSPSDIIYQKPFQCAYKIVESNAPKKVRQLNSNFIPKQEFKESVITVDPEAGKYWFNIRQDMLDANPVVEEDEVAIIDTLEDVDADTKEDSEEEERNVMEVEYEVHDDDALVISEIKDKGDEQPKSTNTSRFNRKSRIRSRDELPEVINFEELNEESPIKDDDNQSFLADKEEGAATVETDKENGCLESPVVKEAGEQRSANDIGEGGIVNVKEAGEEVEFEVGIGSPTDGDQSIPPLQTKSTNESSRSKDDDFEMADESEALDFLGSPTKSVLNENQERSKKKVRKKPLNEESKEFFDSLADELYD